MPNRPLTVPTEAELGMMLVARYETHLSTQGFLQRRVFSIQTLIAVAVSVFGYDAASVFLFR
jgi:hypothetical protein